MRRLPSVSVIIPTYNRVERLLEAIKSLQDQALSELEIIVVDNAADDQLLQIVGRFNHSARRKVNYVPEPSLGLHNARHTGALDCDRSGRSPGARRPPGPPRGGAAS